MEVVLNNVVRGSEVVVRTRRKVNGWAGGGVVGGGEVSCAFVCVCVCVSARACARTHTQA